MTSPASEQQLVDVADDYGQAVNGWEKQGRLIERLEVELASARIRFTDYGVEVKRLKQMLTELTRTDGGPA